MRLRIPLSLAAGLLLLGSTACVRTFSTDIPVNYQGVLEEHYVGRTAWTRQTLQDEKKNVRIEQDQEVKVIDLGMQRNGSVTVVAKQGAKRIVYPFHLPRPLTLEAYEKALLDYLWFESPDERFGKNKEKYGTRIAEAIRDHKLVKDMPKYAAYLSWGAPTNVEFPEGTQVERWTFETPNLTGARIDIGSSGKVVQFDGENIQDTEEAKRKRSTRRGLQAADGR